jgi:hypothetical protein
MANLHRGGPHFISTILCAAALVLGAGCGEAESSGVGISPQVCSTSSAVSAGESAMMEPGGDCIGCHSGGEGPAFTVAGTVMAALHDDTNCSGVAGVTVRLTGADGNAIELTTNATGNFSYLHTGAGGLAFPYQAEVSRNGTTIAMLTPRTAAETSCNACHTASGANGAPGRIVAP